MCFLVTHDLGFIFEEDSNFRLKPNSVFSLLVCMWTWNRIEVVHSKDGSQMQSVSDLCIRWVFRSKA